MTKEKQGILFSELPEAGRKPITFRTITRPLWTEHKAQLIECYLRYFVFITYHGCYIDGFAGPQRVDTRNKSWAAKLVLESQPKRLREFWLCELDPAKVALLNELVAAQESPKNRRIHVWPPGDFNREVDDILARCRIREKTASFCLLDQRTFECEWQTLEKIASFKRAGFKIELLYFLASGWLDRSLKGTTRNTDIIDRWWGRDDWRKLREMKPVNRALIMANRFKSELGYTYATPWPIHKRGRGLGRVMFHMIHASDHPLAPSLMARAYAMATRPRESAADIQAEFKLLGGTGMRPIRPL